MYFAFLFLISLDFFICSFFLVFYFCDLNLLHMIQIIKWYNIMYVLIYVHYNQNDNAGDSYTASNLKGRVPVFIIGTDLFERKHWDSIYSQQTQQLLCSIGQEIKDYFRISETINIAQIWIGITSLLYIQLMHNRTYEPYT